MVLWDNLFSKSFFSHENVIVGGDLNITLGVAEIWGSKAIPDPLSDFFKAHLTQVDLFDIEPIKLNPTWWNRRAGEHRICKKIGPFFGWGSHCFLSIFSGSAVGGVGW